MVLEAGVQFVKEKVVTLVTDKAGTFSNVAPPTAGPSVLSYVPEQSPSVSAVAAVPVALSKSLAPLAAEAFMLVPTGKESVDTTGSLCAKPAVVPPPPPPPPHPASKTSNRQYEVFISPLFGIGPICLVVRASYWRRVSQSWQITTMEWRVLCAV